MDGASRQTGAGISLQLKSPGGDKIEQAIWLGFCASNNESEYEAILAGIELATVLSTDKLIIRSGSQLVVGQVNAEYESRDPRMAKYVTLVKQCLASFSTWKLEHVPRDSNENSRRHSRCSQISTYNRNNISAHILPVGFLNSHYPGKPGGRNLPFLDGPHNPVYQHRRTP